jgi:hypothetical protein
MLQAYQSSPFFEYYEDDITPFYQNTYDSLIDFNNEIIKTICELLQIPTP